MFLCGLVQKDNNKNRREFDIFCFVRMVVVALVLTRILMYYTLLLKSTKYYSQENSIIHFLLYITSRP